MASPGSVPSDSGVVPPAAGMQQPAEPAAQLVQRAAELAASGRCSEAVPLFERAVAEDPAHAEAHEMLAQCCMDQEEDERAYEAAAAAVRLRPGWRAAALTLGRAARNTGRLREAEAAFASCLEGAEGGAGAAGQAAAAAEAEAEAAAAAEELAEVRELLSLALGHQLGLPGLRVVESRGAEAGPGGVAWEAGALLAWFLVQHAGSGGGGCSSVNGGGGGGGGTQVPDPPPAACGHHGGEAPHGCGGCSASGGAPPPAGGSLLRGRRVLELGAGGTGLVGLAAACLGAAVVATDLPEVLPLLSASAALNERMVAAGGGSLAPAPLDWRAPDAALLQPGQPYDWLLGADLVYAERAVAPLVATVAAAAAAAPSLKILLAHKHRHEAVDASLLGALRAAGLPLRAVLRDAGSRCTVYASAAAAAVLGAGG